MTEEKITDLKVHILTADQATTAAIGENDFVFITDQNDFVSSDDLDAKANEITDNYLQDMFTHNSSGTAHQTLYEKAKAYTDASVKDTESIPIYLTQTGLSFTRPAGTGSEITIAATTTERVFFDKSIVIGRSGQVNPNNLYWLKLFFRSASSSRITYMRVQYFVKGIELINEINILNNAQSDFEFGDFLPMNKLTQALDYNDTDQLRIVLSFWVSTGTDNLYLVVGDVNNISALVRLEPVSTGVTKSYVDGAIQQAILDTWEGSY